jgi:hypothetical protein
LKREKARTFENNLNNIFSLYFKMIYLSIEKEQNEEIPLSALGNIIFSNFKNLLCFPCRIRYFNNKNFL